MRRRGVARRGKEDEGGKAAARAAFVLVAANARRPLEVALDAEADGDGAATLALGQLEGSCGDRRRQVEAGEAMAGDELERFDDAALGLRALRVVGGGRSGGALARPPLRRSGGNNKSTAISRKYQFDSFLYW